MPSQDKKTSNNALTKKRKTKQTKPVMDGDEREEKDKKMKYFM